MHIERSRGSAKITLFYNSQTPTLLKKILYKDYTVSGEEFELIYNSDLDMYKTHPQPSEKLLPTYYLSDDYISHTDSNKSVLDKIYQFVKNYTLSKKIKLIQSFNMSEQNLLDIGCGTGDLLKLAEIQNWKVSGVEPNDEARALAQNKITDSNQIVSDLKNLTKASNQFDVITLWHVLEHIPILEDYIKTIKSLLKQNGVLVIAVPNFKSYDAQHYKQFWAAYDVPRHLWHFSQKSINDIFQKHQMKVTQILPMRFDSYYVSILSEKYKTGKSNFINAFWIGLLSNLKARNSSEYSSLIYVIKNV